MKEASGEANITVLTILLIGIVALVATPLISNIMDTTRLRSCCTNAGGKWEGYDCKDQPGFDSKTWENCKKKTETEK